MWSKYLPLLLIVGSGAAYHACQKLVSRDQSPWATLAAAYFIAFLATFAMAVVGKRPSDWIGGVFSARPEVVGLALACVGIELGVLVAYRSGWQMSALSMHTSVAHLTVTALLGVLAFRECLSPTTAAGLALAAIGVGLVHWR